jgi:hypothetical protein
MKHQGQYLALYQAETALSARASSGEIARVQSDGSLAVLQNALGRRMFRGSCTSRGDRLEDLAGLQPAFHQVPILEGSPSTAGIVLLFVDTFTTTTTATRRRRYSCFGGKLTACTGTGVCGRPMISKGMSPEPVTWRDGMSTLAPYARADPDGPRTVVSATLRRVSRVLPDDEDARVASGLLSSSISKPAVPHRLDSRRAADPGPNHCHSRRSRGPPMSGPRSTGAEVRSNGRLLRHGKVGCEREHYDISMQIGG